MVRHLLWTGAALLALAKPVTAQAVTCTAAVDRNRVSQGDRVTLTVTVEGAFQSLPPIAIPSIEGVEIYQGGTSQNFSFINGRTQASVSATYYLQVRQDRSFIIPTLEIEVAGQTYRTQPIRVDVVSQSQAPSGGSQSGPNVSAPPASPGRSGRSATPDNPGSVASSGGRPGDEVFISLTAEKERAFIGEQVVLRFRFHRRIQLWENPQYTAPRTEGFWREDLPPERSYLQNIGGFRYHVTEIRYALFPTRPGRLTIEPAEVTIPIDPLDRFFSFRRRSSGPLHLRTEPLTIEVLPLPQPQPDAFSGIVAGKMDLQATLDRRTVPRGEAVSLRVILSADGFLKSLDELPLSAPVGVRMHDSLENLNVDKSGPSLMSRLTVEKVLVPTVEGICRLEPVRLVYFDPASQQYRTVRSEAIELEVTASDLPVAGDEPQEFMRSEIERLVQDLAFIHSAGNRLRMGSAPLLRTAVGWLALVVPVVLLGLLRLLLARAERARRDPLGVRRRRALSRSRRIMKRARRETDRSAALGMVVQGITGYVADRTGRARAALTAVEVRDYAAACGCAKEGENLAEIVTRCEAERYGTGTSIASERAGSAVPPGDPAEMAREAAEHLTALAKVDAKAGRSAGPVRSLTGAVLILLVFSTQLAAQTGSSAPLPVSSAPAVEQLMAEGNQAYTAGDVETALQRYRAVLQAGVNDPVLHYNLGNAYARRGELGKAVLSYLRAQRLAPRNGDIGSNLAWVRSHTRDLELEPDRLPLVIAQLATVAHGLSLDEWTLVLIAVLWLFCAVLAWSWYRAILSDGLRRVRLALVCLLCVLAAVVGWRWYEEQVRDRAVVVVPEAEVRSGPALTFPVVFRIHDGLTLTVRGQREGWARIGLGGEWVGWIPQESIERVRMPDSRPDRIRSS